MTTSSKIIALVGLPASGKSTLAAHLSDRYGFDWIRTRDIVSALGADGSLTSLQERGLSLSEGEGARAFFAELASRVDRSRNTVIDAIRPLAHWNMLASHFESSILVAVQAPVSLRASRFKGREGADGVTERDSHPVEREVPDLMALASYVVTNIDALEYRAELMLAFVFKDCFMGPLSMLTRFHRESEKASKASAALSKSFQMEHTALRSLRCL
jgi:cytidylate kinase